MISPAAMSSDALNCGNAFSAAADDLDDDRGHGEVAAGRFGLLRVFLPQILERGDVSEIVLRNVRNRRPCGAQMLGGLSPYGLHRLALHCAEPREIRQRDGARGTTADSRARNDAFRVLLHILD